MSRIKRDAGILVLVVILLGIAAYLAFPIAKTKLGLDLQGGLSVVLQAEASAKAPVTSAAMDQAVKIIQNRVNKLGVAEAQVQRQGTDQISVQLPGIKDPASALLVIGKTAVLEFFDVNTQFGKAYTSQADALKAAGVATVNLLPSGKEVIHWPVAAGGTTTDGWYLVTTDPVVKGSDLTGAQQSFDSFNNAKVDMQFNTTGAQDFSDVTTKMADAAKISGKDQLLAIVLDGTVESAPRVQEQISGGQAEITGKFTVDEAKNLALVLQTGALPVNLTPVNQSEIGATLGKAALNQALLAGAVGILLVLLFMIGYYRALGLVADIALVVYGVLFIGILNGIGVTMTLPGIAGMILTVGMAVDANILIFSRMRDEVGNGKTLGPATEAGFRKAFRAIFDCNMTTIIVAVILFWAASGTVRGFALTLGIGVALSMFTAVLVSRSMLVLLSHWKAFRNPRFLGLHVPHALRVDKEAQV